MATGNPSFARGSSISDPPPGIVPTTARLSDILKAHDDAVGHLASGDAVRTEMWSLTVRGASGSERIVRHGTDYHSIIQTGPFTEQYGQMGDARWHMNENGVVSDTTHTEGRSFEMFRVLEDASDPKNDVKLLGEIQTPKPAYIVEVKLPGLKYPEWIFFDKQTALITRTELVFEDHRLVSSYDTYQTVQGLTEPSHIHDSKSTTALDMDYRRQSASFSHVVHSNEFAKPTSKVSYVKIDRVLNLPAHIVHGTVVIRLTVNGRGLDFELSSSDSHSYIDTGIAKELDLPTFGQVTNAEGSAVPYETEIADASIGDLRIQNLALEVLPFSYHPETQTRVVGVLGYDFLSQAIFTVDYVHGKVVAAPNGTPSDEFGLYVIPVWFDDGQPFMTTIIGTHETRNVLLGSSFDFSYVLGSFTQQYPEAVADAHYGKRHLHRIVPFADRASYGRDLDVWIARVPELHVGPMDFLDYDILATNAAWEAGDHPIDAIMGAQLLEFFDVSYDFAHDRVLLKPNDYFKRQFKPRKT